MFLIKSVFPPPGSSSRGRGHIFSYVQPFCKRAVSDLDRSMNRSIWVYVGHNSFIEGSHMTKNTASGLKPSGEELRLSRASSKQSFIY
jgi:hypothetical protein